MKNHLNSIQPYRIGNNCYQVFKKCRKNVLTFAFLLLLFNSIYTQVPTVADINIPITQDVEACYGQEVPDMIAIGSDIKWYSDKGNPMYDFRDGQVYDIVNLGKQTWITENMDIYKPSGTWYYNNDSLSNAGTYGRLYTWKVSQDVCPQGWKIPTDEDWNKLFEFAGGIEIAGGKLKEEGTLHWKSPNTGATNEYGFNARAGGKIMSGKFFKIKKYAKFWSRHSNPEELSEVVLWYDKSKAIIDDPGRNKGLSVRCIKDTTAPVYYGTRMPVKYKEQGVYTFYVTQTIDGIEGPADTVTLNIKACNTVPSIPEPPIVNDTVICESDSISWLYAEGENIKWYSDKDNPLYDTRDGQLYDVVTIGTQTWMQENLNKYTSEKSWYYNNDSITNAGIYGRLYGWEVAQHVCPSGWKLPYDSEWFKLINYLGGMKVAGGQMREDGNLHWNYDPPGTQNLSGFTALPGGVALDTGTVYNGIGSIAWFWSQSFENKGTHFNIFVNVLNFYNQEHNFFIKDGLSLRCLKDEDAPVYIGNIIPVYYNKAGTYKFYVTQSIDGIESPADTVVLTIKNCVVPPPPDVPDTVEVFIDEIPSITGIGENIKWYSHKSNPIYDFRDGQTYNVVAIGNQTWMKENLNYYTANNSWYYNFDSILHSGILGRLYFKTVLNDVCPTGWNIPTTENWDTLINFLGGYDVAGGKSKLTGTQYWFDPNTGATNESGFSAMAGGFMKYDHNFYYKNYGTGFWAQYYAGNPGFYQLMLNYKNTKFVKQYSSNAYSVRCIKDESEPVYLGDTIKPAFDKLGTYKFYVTQTVNEVESKPDSVILQIKTRNPVPPPIVNDSSFCPENIPVLYAKGKNIKWYSDPGNPIFDIRDKQKYLTYRKFTQTWMKENLNHYTPTGSWYYNNDSILNSKLLGRLYSWETAQNVCPEGWALPTTNDWYILSDNSYPYPGSRLKYCGDDRLWIRAYAATDYIDGFNARPGGYTDDGINFFNKTASANFWTYTIDSIGQIIILYNDQNVLSQNADTNFGLSIRCIKEDHAPSYHGDTLTYNVKEPGIYKFYITQTINGIESPPDTATITMNACPIEAPVANDTSSCYGDPQPALYVQGDNIKWYNINPGTFVDERDDLTYKYIVIGNVRWMAENLNYKTAEDGWFYNDDSISYSYPYGRLYTWNTAMEACPLGWRLPTDNDWKNLEIAIGMDPLSVDSMARRGFHAGKLKETGTEHWLVPNSNATDEFGFKAVPAGIMYDTYEYDGDTIRYRNINTLAEFWSSTEKYPIFDPFARSLYEHNQIFRCAADEAMGLSVRCIQDNPVADTGNIFTPNDSLPGLYNYYVTQTQFSRESAYDTLTYTVVNCDDNLPDSSDDNTGGPDTDPPLTYIRQPDYNNPDLYKRITIFPNPTKSIIMLDLYNMTDPIVQVEIINQLGKTVHNEIINVNPQKDRINIDLSTLPKGFYSVRITDKGHKFSKKLLLY